MFLNENYFDFFNCKDRFQMQTKSFITDNAFYSFKVVYAFSRNTDGDNFTLSSPLTMGQNKQQRLFTNFSLKLV